MFKYVAYKASTIPSSKTPCCHKYSIDKAANSLTTLIPPNASEITKITGDINYIFSSDSSKWNVMERNGGSRQDRAPHDDVIKWKHFLRYWPFVWGIHRSPVNSLHKGQWRGALMLSLICAWINSWVNNCEACDLRCHLLIMMSL